MHLFALLSTLLLYVSVATAWPWPPTVQDLSHALGLRGNQPDDIVRRADSHARAAAAATTKAAASKTSAAASTAAASGTQASKSGSKATAAPSVASDAPAGGFTMVTPAQTAQTYAKIGADVTFVWNYTSLLAPPASVDVVASNTAGIWTIAGNISAKETSVIWDTHNLATPLPMESYTLMIYDAELGATAVPKPGHLNPYIGYGFAMYSPKAPVKAKDFYCVTCSGASAMERQSIAVILGTSMLTVLSFTYFSCGFLGVF